MPDLKTAFLLEAVFGASASQLFHTLYVELAAVVRDRAELLQDSVSLQPDTPEVRRLRNEFKAIIDRLKRHGA